MIMSFSRLSLQLADLEKITQESDLLWKVAEILVDDFGFEDCVIYRVVEEQDILVQVSAGGEKNPEPNEIKNLLTIPIGKGITGRSAETGLPILIDDTRTEVNYISDVGGGLSEICVPILIDGKVDAVIDCEARQLSAFDKRHLEFLTFVAFFVAQKVKNIRLQRQLSSNSKLVSMGFIASGIAHDFNNILAIILGSLEVVKHSPGGTKQTTSLVDNSIVAAKRATSIVQSMQAFINGDAQRLVPIDLAQFISRMARENEHSLHKGIELKLGELEDAVGLIDEATLEAVIANLVRNSVEAIEDSGTITLSLQPAEDEDYQTALLPRGKGFAIIQVSDTGSGIDERIIDKIFEPFFSTKQSNKNFGLGLALANKYLIGIGGAIRVINDPGKSCSFRLIIPVLEKYDKNKEKGLTPLPRLEKPAKNILIVDDEASFSDLLKLGLEQAGVKVSVLGSHAESLRFFETDAFAEVDTLICDLHLLDGNGLSVSRHAKSLRPDLLIALMTGFVTPEALEAEKEGVFSTIFRKPFSVEDFVRATTGF